MTPIVRASVQIYGIHTCLPAYIALASVFWPFPCRLLVWRFSLFAFLASFVYEGEIGEKGMVEWGDEEWAFGLGSYYFFCVFLVGLGQLFGGDIDRHTHQQRKEQQ